MSRLLVVGRGAAGLPLAATAAGVAAAGAAAGALTGSAVCFAAGADFWVDPRVVPCTNVTKMVRGVLEVSYVRVQQVGAVLAVLNRKQLDARAHAHLEKRVFFQAGILSNTVAHCYWLIAAGSYEETKNK
jgi:hypothetical protein